MAVQQYSKISINIIKNIILYKRYINIIIRHRILERRLLLLSHQASLRINNKLQYDKGCCNTSEQWWHNTSGDGYYPSCVVYPLQNELILGSRCHILTSPSRSIQYAYIYNVYFQKTKIETKLCYRDINQCIVK